MGSVGKSGASASAQPTDTIVLDENSSSADIQAYYKDKLAIDIGGSYFRDNCSTEALLKATESLRTLSDELGLDVLKEMGIRIVSVPLGADAYANTDLVSHKVRVNSSLFSNTTNLDKTYKSDLSHGFHPKGTNFGDVITHEVGHNIEFLLLRRQFSNDKAGQLLAQNSHLLSKAIFDQAFTECQTTHPGLYPSKTTARKTLSGYANAHMQDGRVNYTETLAEAVADYARNKQNANPISISMWKGIKALL